MIWKQDILNGTYQFYTISQSHKPMLSDVMTSHINPLLHFLIMPSSCIVIEDFFSSKMEVKPESLVTFLPCLSLCLISCRHQGLLILADITMSVSIMMTDRFWCDDWSFLMWWLIVFDVMTDRFWCNKVLLLDTKSSYVIVPFMSLY